MTSYCGCFVRRNSPGGELLSDGLDNLRLKARNIITRNPSHLVQEYKDSNFFLLAFDNGAWSNGIIHETTKKNIGWVSGNPLVSDEYGSTLPIENGCVKIINALENDECSSLIATNGSFAAVVWNPIQNNLKLSADKLGLRPVYIYLSEDVCYFATSIRVLRSLLRVELDFNDEGIGQFLYLGQCISGKTCYESVQVITPGCYFEITSLTYSKIQYFSWDKIKSINNLGFDDIAAGTYDLFMRATKRRINSSSNAEAFLTGGMDSRSVIAALIDSGLNVRGFNYSYVNSADHILGQLLAEKLGVDCVFYHSNPRDRLKVNLDYFALRAKIHFPSNKSQHLARTIWSGDGGSVGLGHVYLTTKNIALAEQPLTPETAIKIFGNLGEIGSRLLRSDVEKKLRKLALDSLIEYWASLNPAQPSRRLFLYYLLNDQMRHLHHHYEEIDISNIEFETPFFDMDFLGFIVSLPVNSFLKHKLYNNFIRKFSAPVSDVPWQSYPGHEPCDLPLPKGISSQWGTDWYGGRTGSDISKIVVDTILNDGESLQVRKYFSRKMLLALKWGLKLGVNRYNYETNFARRFYEELSGRFVFDIYS